MTHRDLTTVPDADLHHAVDRGRLGDEVDPFDAMAEIDRRQSAQDAEIRRLYVDGRLSERAIAERLGCSRHAVRQAMERLPGLQRPPRSEQTVVRWTRDELEEVDEAAERVGEDRSTYVREAALRRARG